MPLHFQTISRVFGVAARQIARYNRYESKLFKSAYRGFPRGFGRGARHGYVAGSIVGSLINDPGQDLSNGFPSQSPSRKFTEKRRGSKYGSSRYNKYRFRQRLPRCRPGRSRFRRRSNYRFNR